jgi:uncharacterized OsmC-like protein
MKTSLVKYKGELQTEITHIKSASSSLTDAPVDNNGKGSNFSPTDLVATSLASCMITVIGIHCNKNGLHFNQAEAYVTKRMTDNPRRISEIEVDLDLSGNDFTVDLQDRITRIAKNCPVAKSLNSEIIQNLKINF